MDRDQERRAGKTWSIAMSVFALLFSIVWCIVVIRLGAWFMAIFGLFFAGMAAYRLVMMLKLSREGKKEPEPWDPPRRNTGDAQTGAGNTCPYCGETVEARFAFCPICGRRLR